MASFVRRQAINLYERIAGRHIMGRMAEMEDTQWLSYDELMARQRQKLHRLLRYAQTYVPYYQRLFERVEFEPDEVLEDVATLEKVPFLTKDLIREHFDDLLTTEPERRAGMSQLSTAGSTGQPLVFMQDVDFRDNVTAALHHHLTWAGWAFGEPHAYIYGASFEMSHKRSLRAQLMNWSLNRFVTNAYVLSDASMHAFAQKVLARRPRLVFAYASSMYRFAQFVREHPEYDLSFIDAVMTTSDVLYPGQRQFIEEVFGCQVFNRYATRELGPLACECEGHIGLHVSVLNAYVEILQDGRPAQPDEEGDIFVTGLNNYGMPFIRYQLADKVSWHPDDHCPCGRAHPMIKVVAGRDNDMFRTRDGGTVWGGIGNPLWNMAGVEKFQFIQKTYDDVVVKVVKEDGPLTQAQEAEVVKAVRTALGDQVQLAFEYLDDIPVERSGKHRYQICEIDEV